MGKEQSRWRFRAANLLAKRCILFVNLRRIQQEGFESLLAAHRLGYDVLLLGHTLPDFARPLIKAFSKVDTHDINQAVSAAVELSLAQNVVGVASFTEMDVQLVSAITARLGLPGLTGNAARRARNKYLMKDALRHLDGVLPRFARVQSVDDLYGALDAVGLPAVVKPTGASGSKGIFELHRAADVDPAMRHLKRIANPEFDAVFREFGAEFIVEEFVDGPEVSVEGFVSAGKVHLVAVTDKVTSDPYHVEIQHILPSCLPTGVIDQIRACTGQVVTELGFDSCAFHLEAKWDANRFRLIEVAARPGGDYIASHLVPLATGIDFFENVIRTAVGERLELTPLRRSYAGLRFVLAERTGCFVGLEGLNALLDQPCYQHVFLEVPIGTHIQLPPEQFGLQRVAAVCARHAHRSELDSFLAWTASHVRPLIAGPEG